MGDRLCATIEYLAGRRETPPEGLGLSLGSPLWGVWWGLLACLIYAFSGQASRFIYIDF